MINYNYTWYEPSKFLYIEGVFLKDVNIEKKKQENITKISKKSIIKTVKKCICGKKINKKLFICSNIIENPDKSFVFQKKNNLNFCSERCLYLHIENNFKMIEAFSLQDMTQFMLKQ